ncbi:MAG: tRNA guanosine(34) transglycosylase Tgt [Candidatus Eisenbacteria bacterium]
MNTGRTTESTGTPEFGYELLASSGRARRGRVRTPHGTFETPAFMPVGTQGTVKTLTSEEVAGTGSGILLGNTYHLYLRPGHETVARLGGLHRFMSWPRPILTDSGGYQVFSLARLTRMEEDGVVFQSHLDGSRHHLGPELSIRIQIALGSDIVMAFDTMTPYPSDRDRAREDLERTTRWAEVCRRVWQDEGNPGSALFGIVQGGTYDDLRAESAEQLVALGLPGYAVGGLSVGEPMEECYRVLEGVVPLLPEDRPRYLMGVGRPEDIIEAVDRGIDMFDCVLPTRNARKGTVFTSRGKLVIKNRPYAEDLRPLDPDCACPVCRTYSRAYIRHLFQAREFLALKLASLHSLSYYQRLMQDIRAAIAEGRWSQFRDETLARLGTGWKD